MYFLLEESSWAWDGREPEAYVERIEQLLDRLDTAHEREEEFATSTELLEQKVTGGHTLADLLWGPELAMSHDVQERITTHFGRLRFWDEATGYSDFEAEIAGKPVLSPSAVFVHGRAGEGETIACLPLPGTWRGPCVVRVADRAALVHFVTDEASHRAFFRAAIATRATGDALEPLAPHAFPDTCFVETVWRGVREFKGGYAHVRDDLLKFLGEFDDHAAWAYNDETGRRSRNEPIPGDAARRPVTNVLLEERFRALGLDVSRETLDVEKTARLRQQRERVVGGRLLYCEWHYKIEGHQNRVHFHAPVAESEHRPIIAIFHEHLDLPGD